MNFVYDVKVCSTEFVGICEILVNWMICVSGRPTWAPLQKKALSSWDNAFFYDDYKLHENRMIEGIGVCHKASRGDPWGARYGIKGKSPDGTMLETTRK